MRKIIYAMPVSLDGYIEAADGDLRWSFPDEELHKHFNEQEALIGVHFYGPRLYEHMASYWPAADGNPSVPETEREYARMWKVMKKIVFPTTLKKVEWNSERLDGNIAKEINRLTAQPGKPMSVGGAGIASAFIRLGLIDEYRLYVCLSFSGAVNGCFLTCRTGSRFN